MDITRENHCPVCNMEVNDDRFTLEYLKSVYRLCSEQCLETFNTRPALYTGTLVKSVGKVIKRRKIHLKTPIKDDLAGSVTDYLTTLMGVEEVHLKGRILFIHYDLLQLTLKQLETFLSKKEVQLDTTWWQRIQRAWIHNTEENELYNLALPQGACCNRPPPRV